MEQAGVITDLQRIEYEHRIADLTAERDKAIAERNIALEEVYALMAQLDSRTA